VPNSAVSSEYVGVLAAFDARLLVALGTRAEVDLEALGEAEIRIDPAVPPDSRGSEARLLKDLRGHLGVRGDRVVGAQHARSNRVQPRPQGRHRALRPGRLGNLLGEAYTGRCEAVDVRAGIAPIAVSAESVRPQCVDEDEQHVQVALLAQGEHVFECASGAGIAGADYKTHHPDGDQRECSHGYDRHQQPAAWLLLHLGLAHCRGCRRNRDRCGKRRGGDSCEPIPAAGLLVISRFSASGCCTCPPGTRSRYRSLRFQQARVRRIPSSSTAGRPGSSR